MQTPPTKAPTTSVPKVESQASQADKAVSQVDKDFSHADKAFSQVDKTVSQASQAQPQAPLAAAVVSTATAQAQESQPQTLARDFPQDFPQAPAAKSSVDKSQADESAKSQVQQSADNAPGSSGADISASMLSNWRYLNKSPYFAPNLEINLSVEQLRNRDRYEAMFRNDTYGQVGPTYLPNLESVAADFQIERQRQVELLNGVRDLRWDEGISLYNGAAPTSLAPWLGCQLPPLIEAGACKLIQLKGWYLNLA